MPLAFGLRGSHGRGLSFPIMRIRTIKPEFWTDSLLVSMSRDTRLLYIGLWNASDDHGWLPDDADQLKMLLFPGDADFDMEVHLEILIAAGRVERYLHDSGSVLRIAHWLDHQKVDHPGKSRLFRESSRKLAIPFETRRGVAIKYGCTPGGQVEAKCYFCDAEGVIHWHKLRNGRPSAWVTFSGLELDHFVPEACNGKGTTENIILSCRHCNRSKGTTEAIEFLSRFRESSRVLAPEQGTGNREQGTGNKEQGTETPKAPKGAASLSPEQIEVGSWFGRRASTAWSEKETKAWVKLSPDSVTEGITVLAAPYRAKVKFTRQDLQTLLNNWLGEIDRWRNWAAPAASDVKPLASGEGLSFLDDPNAVFFAEDRERELAMSNQS